MRLNSFLGFLVILLPEAFSQPDLRSLSCSIDKGNYTANSAYEANLKTLLSTLTSDTKIEYGFYNFSYGQNSDKVNAIGLCRGDLKADACRGCLYNVIILLPRLCPYQKEAMGFYDECILRYSNRSISGFLDAGVSIYLFNPYDAYERDKYNQVVQKLLERLISKAAAGDSHKKFAAGNEMGPAFQTIYGLVQCIPDLSKKECNECLIGAMAEIPNCCDKKRGGRVVKSICNIRYESNSFYDLLLDAPATSSPPQESPPTLPRQSTNSNSSKETGNPSPTVVAIVVPVASFVALLLIFICIFLRAKTPWKLFESETEADEEIQQTETLQFDFDTLKLATNNFSEANKLGQGGFGPVYKGTLSNGQEVAIKRLSSDNGQGDIEFKNEMLLVAKLQHRNLVTTLGFCLEKKERLLVYELVSNKSLDYFIFDPIKRLFLNWDKRFKIIKGIARGLLYLHEDSRLRIIHRDLKASNILLDEKMNPKISDFGMARLFFVDQYKGNTNRIVGTHGYMAPEYAIQGYFSIKSDIFSFGVLVLEIISGHKNSKIRDGEFVEHIVSFVWRNWRKGKISKIIDPTLDVGSRNEMMRCIHIALLCVQEKVAKRPTMASVMLMLESNSVTLPIPSQPAFFVHGTNLSETQSLEHNVGETNLNNHVEASRNEASITELYPR